MARLRALVPALVLLSVPPSLAAAQPAEFYRGKTITLQIGYAPGGGYDLYARHFARHYTRFVPGNPTIATQNVPGAGSLKLANAIHNAAPRDGTVIGAIGREQVTAGLFGVAGVQFDATKVNWIGNLDRSESLCVVWHSAPFKTIDDVRTRELVVGGTGPASTTVTLPTALNQVMGFKFKVVAGYPGGNDITLALERGEVQGRCSWSYPSIMSTQADWVRDGKIRFLAAAAFRRIPEVPDVPTVLEIAADDRQRQIIALVLANQIIARPILAPPDVPADRLQALRDAFVATVSDKQFLAEAERQEMELNPMDWKEMTETIQKFYATPKDIVNAAIRAIQRDER